MPTYNICYLTNRARLSAELIVSCTNDLCARILAHAMQPRALAFEVWKDNILIYARPARDGQATLFDTPL